MSEHGAKQAQRRRARLAVPQSRWAEAFDLARLREEQPAFLAKQLALKTAKNYAGQARLFEEFAAQVFGSGGRMDADAIALWIQQRAKHHHRFSSIEAGLAALSHAAQERGLPPPRSHAKVVAALRAAKRVAPGDKKQKLPLSAALLRAVLDYSEGQPDEWMIVRDKALFYTGFYGMFRGSELVGVRWEHLHFPRSGGIMVFVPHSQTDPSGQGAWEMQGPAFP